jgi:rhamnosyltransferase
MTDHPKEYPLQLSLCAVMVTYYPDSTVVQNLRAIVDEGIRVLIVDNGSGPEALAYFSTLPEIEVIALGANQGVATALNRGAAWARERGYAWMVTFDQDSKLVPGLAAGLWDAHLRHPRAAVIGPCILEGEKDDRRYRWVRRHPDWPLLFQRVKCEDEDLPEITLLITSGSMVELEAWARLGGFTESLFIDYVDIDYCLKVVRMGRTVAVAAGASLQHKLGARQTGRILGKDLRPTHHAAFRHYYIARNRVMVWRWHALTQPHWAFFDLTFALFNGFRVVVFEPQKWAKLKAMILGTWDGLRGCCGPCPESRMRAFQS